MNKAIESLLTVLGLVSAVFIVFCPMAIIDYYVPHPCAALLELLYVIVALWGLFYLQMKDD